MAKTTAGDYPKQWRDWCKAVTDKRIEPSPKLNLFAARYRAARLVHGLHVAPERKGGEWERGFAALLNVFLAYTASESLARGLPGHYQDNLSGFRVESMSLAKRIRKNEGILKLLIAEIVNGKLISKLNAFANGQSDDVFCVASAIRHLVAHGTITVGGANVGSKEKAEALLRLADAVLEFCDRTFSEFCSTRLHVSSTGTARR